MSSPNKGIDQEFREKLRHDLKPLLLGLRATMKALEKNNTQDARELVEEIEKRVMKLIEELV
jgi:hypothetical protein